MASLLPLLAPSTASRLSAMAAVAIVATGASSVNLLAKSSARARVAREVVE